MPQVMAVTRDPDHAMSVLVSARIVVVKRALTICTLFVGASTRREGPNVQIAASIMGYAHRIMAIPLRVSVFIAGGAAGVARAVTKERLYHTLSLSFLPPHTETDHDAEPPCRGDDADVSKSGHLSR